MKLPNTEAMDAAIMLVGHTGARTLEIGYLHDNVPSVEAAWWASATYQGAKIQVEDHVGPAEAVEALAERLLSGALCQWCKGLVALHSDGTMAFPGTVMADGSKMPDAPQDIAALGQCLWERHGDRWEPGCLHDKSTAPGAPKYRAARRRLAREYEKSRTRDG